MLENLPLPEWALVSPDGGPVPQVSRLAGRPLLLLMFHVDCPGCIHRALPFALKLSRAYPDVQVMAIHTQPEGFNRSADFVLEALRQLSIPFPVWLDEGDTTYKRFGAEGTPHWWLTDQAGIVQKSIFGSMLNSLHRLDYGLSEMFQVPG
ncbi:MAG: TlpA disulfide reductase family protein [Bacteroidia bacterium]|nr:TlpA disulfide reductase family protein [Bacteroidia bacterium]